MNRLLALAFLAALACSPAHAQDIGPAPGSNSGGSGITALTGDVTASGTGSVGAALANTATARADLGLGAASTPLFAGAALNLNAAALPTLQSGTSLQLGNADGTSSRIEIDGFASTSYFSGVRRDGTNASPTTLQSGDEIGGFNAWGYNGTAIVGPKVAFRTYASQNWSTTANGTYADVATTLAGTTTMAEVCRFENDGGMTCPSTVSGGDHGAGTITVTGFYGASASLSGAVTDLSETTSGLTVNGNVAISGTTTTGTLVVTGALTDLSETTSSLTNKGTTTLSTLTTGALSANGTGVIVSGTLPVGDGGTGATTLTQYGVLIGNGTSAVSAIAPVTTSGWLFSATATAPTWTAPAASPTGTTGQVAYFSGTNAVTGSTAVFQSTTGSVGIGTTAPAYPLHIYYSNNAYAPGLALYNTNSGVDATGGALTLYNSDGNGAGEAYPPSGATGVGAAVAGNLDFFSNTGIFFFANNAGGHSGENIVFLNGSTTLMTLSSSGGVSIPNITNANTGDYVCWNGGTLEYDATACAASLAKYKENVANITGALQEVMQLRPIEFTYKPQYHWGTKKQLGLIAEEVEKIDPRIAAYKDDGQLEGVDYPKMSTLAFAAIQEQQQEISALSPGISPYHRCVSFLPILCDSQ